MQSLYQALQSAGIPTDSHESDLYFQDTAESRAILSQYPDKAASATRFTNQAPPHVGEQWVEVPFAFDPFWEAKAR